MLEDLFIAVYHAVVYALLAGALLVAAYYVLDLLIPGHLGRQLLGVDETGTESVHHQSKSAALVTAAWLASNALVLFTAIWRNGETDLGWALGYTLAFGALGIVLNGLMLVVIDLITPGDLRRVVSEPGPVRPYAVVAAATSLSVAAIVCASIA